MDNAKMNKITIEEISKLAITTISKALVLEPVLIDRKSEILRPEVSVKSAEVMLRVLHADSECRRVKPGDYVITLATATLTKFEIGDDEYVCCVEDDVSCILRQLKLDRNFKPKGIFP